MFKKLITFLLVCGVVFTFSRCEDDGVASKPAVPGFDVDQNSGLVGVTEFTFTIQEVNADNVTLYPYGLSQASQGTVPLTFEDGEAVVKFKYANVGVFDAVVVSNNHTETGSSVKNTVSDAITITITNDEASITEFTLDYITGTGDDKKTISADSVKIDEGAGTIDVWVPFKADVTALTATFKTSDFATVEANGDDQTSGEGTVDFSSPVTYTVNAQNGTDSKDYVVTVTQQAVETNSDVKSVSGVLYSANLVKDGAGKSIPGYAGSDYVVLYAHNITAADRDSVSVSFELDGKYATADLGQGDSLNLTTSKSFTVTAEDESTQDYDIYAVLAPTIKFSLNDLNPVVTGTGNDFSLDLKVLSQTGDVVNVYRTPSSVPAGVSVIGYSITNGEAVDFSDGPVEVEVYVSDSNIGETYTVTYTLNLIKQ